MDSDKKAPLSKQKFSDYTIKVVPIAYAEKMFLYIMFNSTINKSPAFTAVLNYNTYKL